MIHCVRKWGKIDRVAIIDLDAHQGNGHERDFTGKENTFIIDLFNPSIYPGDTEAMQGISIIQHVFPSDNDSTYLGKLGEALNSP